jgi:hypothetical protein
MIIINNLVITDPYEVVGIIITPTNKPQTWGGDNGEIPYLPRISR